MTTSLIIFHRRGAKAQRKRREMQDTEWKIWIKGGQAFGGHIFLLHSIPIAPPTQMVPVTPAPVLHFNMYSSAFPLRLRASAVRIFVG
jgi:hypothetical protein